MKFWQEHIYICSSHTATGQEEYNGKMYYFDFSDRFGPLFTNKRGDVLDKQPGVRSYAWKAFNAWYDGYTEVNN